MEEIYTEKEILGDALNTEKNATALYNLSANECDTRKFKIHNDGFVTEGT